MGKKNNHQARAFLKGAVHIPDFFLKTLTEQYSQTTFRINENLVKAYWKAAQSLLQSEENGPWFQKVLQRFARDWERLFPEIKGICRWNPSKQASHPSDPHGRELIRNLDWYHHVAIVTLILMEMGACIPAVRYLLLHGADQQWSVLDYVTEQIDLDGLKRGMRRLGLKTPKRLGS